MTDVIRLDGLEPRRGCGYRHIGKLYLIGEGLGKVCHRLPLKLPEECPCCGAGIKFHRGFQWINPQQIFGFCYECTTSSTPLCDPSCPVCNPPEKVGLMWVGERYYPRTIDFTMEAEKYGISKAIASVPKGLELGKTWVYLAHRKAVVEQVEDENTLTGYREEHVPGIFYAFRPVRIEMLIKESDATEENLEKLKKRGITPVIVPDNWDEMKKEAEEKEKEEKKKRKKKPAEAGR